MHESLVTAETYARVTHYGVLGVAVALSVFWVATL